MLAETGATLVELGHSERRAAFNESDAAINRKVHSALGHGLRPLICIGDSAEEKRWQVSRESVVRQMKIALYGLSHQQALRTLIAYEPVWAIGEHGTPASPQEAGVIHQALRQALCERFGHETGTRIPLLYGGSVTLQNAVELLRQQRSMGCLSAARPGTRKAIATLFNALHRNLFCRRSNIKGTPEMEIPAMIEQDSDYALLTEIAVAYYDQEQTQEEIAKRFGISRIKVGRLLKKRARRDC